MKFLIFFVLFFMLSCSSVNKNSENSNLKQNTITLAFVGDVILHERLRTREEKTKEGYQVIWQEIQAYLSSADLTYANLEGPVAPDIGGMGTYPMFNFPEKIIPNLKDSGFDVVSTANNHALDRFSIGIKKTIANLNKYKLSYSGTISSEKALVDRSETWWALTPINGSAQSVAWLACTEATNGMADKNNQVLHCFKDREKIKSYIQQLSVDASVAFIILNPHWGTEDKFKIARYRSIWAQEMIDQGAVAVVGSHPHVIQKIENINSADGRKAVVNYSLGNFVSNQRNLKNRLSIIYYIKMQMEANGQYTLKESKALPLWMNRTIKKDRTAVYRLTPIWDFAKLPKEIKKTWFENINTEYLFKDEDELKSFLNIPSVQ
ncbi:CapA family protein [bacterium]|nr:CapA family protein [bacterium]